MGGLPRASQRLPFAVSGKQHHHKRRSGAAFSRSSLSLHLATVQLEMLAGIKTAQIPYRGLSQALNDLIAEHVDMMFDTPTTSLALHRDGKVKIVAVGTTERVRELPEVPTVAESGLPGYRAVTWYAMVAPP